MNADHSSIKRKIVILGKIVAWAFAIACIVVMCMSVISNVRISRAEEQAQSLAQAVDIEDLDTFPDPYAATGEWYEEVLEKYTRLYRDCEKKRALLDETFGFTDDDLPDVGDGDAAMSALQSAGFTLIDPDDRFAFYAKYVETEGSYPEEKLPSDVVTLNGFDPWKKLSHDANLTEWRYLRRKLDWIELKKMRHLAVSLKQDETDGISSENLLAIYREGRSDQMCRLQDLLESEDYSGAYAFASEDRMADPGASVYMDLCMAYYPDQMYDCFAEDMEEHLRENDPGDAVSYGERYLARYDMAPCESFIRLKTMGDDEAYNSLPDVPEVGMTLETAMSGTKIGPPTADGLDYRIMGNSYKHRDLFWNGGLGCLFWAHIEDGKVSETANHLSKPVPTLDEENKFLSGWRYQRIRWCESGYINKGKRTDRMYENSHSSRPGSYGSSSYSGSSGRNSYYYGGSSDDSFNVDDYDIDTYYEDNMDEYEDYEDAEDGIADDPDAADYYWG